ncbi:MAG TPA: hypothetical protein VGL81_34605 [Polyangiaceae bacterium]|jgi:hypothetical protein
MRLHPGVGLGFGLALILAVPGACNNNSSASGDDGGAIDGTIEDGDDAAEPLICTEFTAVGAPCSTPSPVRCFAECEAGGCYCTATPSGPRWTCQSDLSCVADCGPLDDGCAAIISGDDATGDDGPGDDGAEDAGAPGDASGDGGDGAGPGDAADASG